MWLSPAIIIVVLSFGGHVKLWFSAVMNIYVSRFWECPQICRLLI